MFVKRLSISIVSLLFLSIPVFAEEKKEELKINLEDVKTAEKIEKAEESNGVIDFIPLLQKQAREVGAVPPKPFFIAPLAFIMGDTMIISDVKASVNLPITIPDGTFKMSNTRIRSNTFGARAGFWLFPFMSIYGMYANSTGTTSFDIDLPPALAGFKDQIQTTTKFNANTYAVGATVAYGVKDVFLGLDVFGNMDLNYSWTTVDILDDTMMMLIFSPRIGIAREITKMFNVAVWIGGMYKGGINAEEGVSGMYPLGGGVVATYSANQRPISPWNMVAGAKLGISRYFDLIVEAGFINRWAFNVNTSFNF